MTTTDQLLQELRGTATLKELGDRYGVTRERIRQILNKHGIPPRPVNGRAKCLWCKKPVDWYATFCRLHEQWTHYIIVECDECGAYFSRAKCWINMATTERGYRGQAFCSTQCSQRNVEKTKWWESSPIWQSQYGTRWAKP